MLVDHKTPDDYPLDKSKIIDHRKALMITDGQEKNHF